MARGKKPGLSGTHAENLNDGTFARAASPRPGLLGASATPFGGAIYEEDVHDDLTEVLALAAGFGQAEAREIAAANQRTDTNPATSPMPYWTRNSWGVPYYSVGVGRRRLWHFTTQARQNEVKRQYQQSGSLEDLGRYMHVLQDSFSHEGLSPVVGQIGTSVDPLTKETVYNSPNPLDTAPWHEADDPAKNPGKAMAMARRTYEELVEAKEHLAQRGKLRISFEPVSYDPEIAQLVKEFCYEPDKRQRITKTGQIGAVALQRRDQQEKAMYSELQSQFEETERRRTRTIQPKRKKPPKRRN